MGVFQSVYVVVVVVVFSVAVAICPREDTWPKRKMSACRYFACIRSGPSEHAMDFSQLKQRRSGSTSSCLNDTLGPEKSY